MTTFKKWEAIARQEIKNSLESNFRRAEAIFHLDRDPEFWGQFESRRLGIDRLSELCDGLAIECYEDLVKAINWLPTLDEWKACGKFTSVLAKADELRKRNERPDTPRPGPKPRPNPTPAPRPIPTPPAPVDSEPEMPWEFDDELQKHAGSLTHEQKLAMLLVCVQEIESVFGIPHKTATAKIRDALESRRFALAGH